MRAFTLGLAIATAVVGGDVARAQAVTGEVGIFNKYLDYDLLALTDEPVVQAALYAQVSGACTLMGWGSHGIGTDVGGELDVGGICRLQVAKSTTVSVFAMRSLLRNFQDATTISAGITRGAADLTIERYFWDRNPGGTRIYGGYTVQLAKGATVKPMAVTKPVLGYPIYWPAG